MVLGRTNRTTWPMGYQTAPHGSLGLPCGLYQFMSLTEGTALLFESELVLRLKLVRATRLVVHWVPYQLSQAQVLIKTMHQVNSCMQGYPGN